ncbi:helix-turn-helix domain-containing protein [Croceicoccus ponticola]|uniref:Helix-turn-helix domain-containing protein n=1 Tax=Croceicoccus ponticola TaxID=2217664 RepID=A0A437GVH9_9SPHN|nr:helix-turn-helix domain-containing protein [Croceicoccus ponticola]RVQ65796.1 helix-turn-helix domain-containing protein [Croceicoccus ponticola]
MRAFLRIRDFQEDYNVSRSTVYRLHERGEIRFVHIGRAVRIAREDAERWYDAVTSKEANDV